MIFISFLIFSHLIISKLISEFLFDGFRKVVVFKAILSAINSSPCVETNRANVEPTKDDARGAHYAWIMGCNYG
jgi:hypothetical protein